MIKIRVLLENNSINNQYKSKHGLSLLLYFNNEKILLDTGPDKNFLKNAHLLGIDLANSKFLFLSHNHMDHTGGINHFLKINKTASVYLMDDINNKYYVKRHNLFIPLSLRLKRKYKSRIIQVKDDFNINNQIYFLKNSIEDNKKPAFNSKLYKKENGKIIPDTFDHEGILVLEDNNELAVFNSCSHNGILNIIETVKQKIPNKKIRSYTGGLHLCNPGTKQHEGTEYLDYLLEKIKELDINIFTGHCTGRIALDYLKEKSGGTIREINTGMELEV